MREVLQLLDLSGYSRTVVTAGDGAVVYDDGGSAGGMTDNPDILSSLDGKCVFRSSFDANAFSAPMPCRCTAAVRRSARCISVSWTPSARG